MGLLGFIGFTYLSNRLFDRKKQSVYEAYSDRLSREIDLELELEDMQEDLDVMREDLYDFGDEEDRMFF